MGNSSYVETVAAEPVSAVVAELLGVSAVGISARAEARKLASPEVYFLSQHPSQPSLFMGNQRTTQTTCSHYLGLFHSFTGGAPSSGSQYYVAGSSTSSKRTVSPTPICNVATMTDPLSTLTARTVGSNCTPTGLPCIISASAGLRPETYLWWPDYENEFHHHARFGYYIILGSLTINGPTLTGFRVTLYMTQNSKCTYSASAISNVNITL